MRLISLSIILVRNEYLAKIYNLLNQHRAGAPEAQGPIQPHRLHWLEAGPAYSALVL